MASRIQKRKTVTASVRGLLERSKGEFAKALPKTIRSEQFIRTAMTTIQNNPKLLGCDATSLIAGCMEAAQLGLQIDGTLGHAYLVPYGSRAQLIVGYKGLLSMAWKSELVRAMSARVVHQNDHFRVNYGKNELDHIPVFDSVEQGEAIAYYAIIETTLGGKLFEVLTMDEVIKVRDRSRAGKSGPWVTDFDAMAKKTVLIRALKLAPLTTEAARAVAVAEQADNSYAPFPTPSTLDMKDYDVKEKEKNSVATASK